MLQVKYDTKKYDFKTLFENILEVDDLTKIYTEGNTIPTITPTSRRILSVSHQIYSL